MQALDLFCGAGGASLGLLRAGVDVLGLDAWSKAIDVHRIIAGPAEVADLAAVDPAILPDAPLWWASPPCQPASQAGARLGAADPRNGYPHLLRLVRVRRPRWLVVEQVPGARQHKARAGCKAGSRLGMEGCVACYHEAILRELGVLYPHVSARVLNAADYGVPQHRRRLFVVCSPVPFAWPEPTHGPGRAHPWVSAGEALGLVAPGAIATGQNTTAPGGRRVPHLVSTEAPAPTVRASRSSMWLSWGGPNARNGQGPSLRSLDAPAPTVRCTADVYLLGAGTNPHGPGREYECTYRDITHEPAPTVCASPAGNAGPWVIYGAGDGEGRPRPVDRPAPTVSARGTMQIGSGGPQHRAHVESPATRRTLTVPERAALQSLPWVPGLTGRMVGNAVPPPLAEALGRAILACISGVFLDAG